jgi:SnoaL-like domain
MSQDRVAIIRALIERWNVGERGSVSLPEYFDPAIELESPLSSVVDEPYRGYAGIEQWISDVDEQFAEWRIRLDDARQSGNQVIAIGTVNARGRASDIALQLPAASVHDFGSDDRVTRMHIYPTVEEAFKAVGLEA